MASSSLRFDGPSLLTYHEWHAALRLYLDAGIHSSALYEAVRFLDMPNDPDVAAIVLERRLAYALVHIWLQSRPDLMSVARAVCQRQALERTLQDGSMRLTAMACGSVDTVLFVMDRDEVIAQLTITDRNCANRLVFHTTLDGLVERLRPDYDACLKVVQDMSVLPPPLD